MISDRMRGAPSCRQTSTNGSAGNWIVGAGSGGRGLRRRLLQALRMAHRVLGITRAGKGTGPMGFAGGRMGGGIGLTAAGVAVIFGAGTSAAQTVPVVRACSGVQLPRSVVTDILRPVINGVVAPIENTVNPILGVVRVIPIVGQVLPPLSIDTTTLLSNAAAGQPITLSVLNSNGVLVGPSDACNVQADSFHLRNPQGIAIGGNRITGLGTGTVAALAGEGTSIAFGNAASTAGTAIGSIAFGTGATVGANANGGIALGTGAQVTVAGGTAIGAGALASRGALAGYTAFGLGTAVQTSAGEVSVGTAGATRQITNVAAGSAPTDAVNVAQLQGVAAQIGVLDPNAVRYDAADKARITLGGATGTVLGNVAAGAVAAGSTEAVNGDQLFATNTAVTNNNTAITNLSTSVTNGAIGAVRYVDAATPTLPNGGTPTNDVAVIGAAPGAVGIHNVRDGVLAAGSTDAVNGGQLFATNTQLTATGNAVTNVNTALTTLTTNVDNGAVGTVRYSDPSNPNVPNGGVPTNSLALVGGAAGAVTLHNVGDGALAAGSTDAVNGGQLYTTNTQLAATGAAVTNVNTRVDLLNGVTVQYDDATRSRVTLGGAGAAPVVLTNVQAGTLAAGSTDAVNGGQLAALGSSVAGAIGGGSGYDPANNALNVELTYNGAQYNTIQGVVSALSNTVVGGASSRFFAVNSVGQPATATGADGVAIGAGAQATADNSVALGANAATVRGAQAGYAAAGLAGVQTSAGEVSVGAAGATRQLTNVAAGSGATDAVNVAQLQGATAGSIRYDNADQGRITLAGGSGTVIGNVAAGAVTATSTEAVNGEQLNATNQAVAGNTAAITNLGTTVTNLGNNVGALTTNVTNLTNSVNNGSVGAVQYSNAATPNTPNGGTRTNDVALVGAAAGPVGLHNVRDGVIALGSTDAVNGGQVYAINAAAANAVQYSTDANGNRTNTLALIGGNASAPVTIANVAAGTLASGSTQAVNGGQLFATNQGVAAAQATASSAFGLGQNSVQYDSGRTSVTFNGGGNAVTLRNVAAGVNPTDGVNVAQLDAGIGRAVSDANAYTDTQIGALSYDLRSVRRGAYAGTAGAMAVAGLPQAMSEGKGMLAMAAGTYMGQAAFAIGGSKILDDGRAIAKVGATLDSRSRVGASAGVGFQF